MSTSKSLLLSLILLFSLQHLSHAQTKVGYANVELILAYIPETNAIQQQLVTYQKSLEAQIRVKQNDLQLQTTKYNQDANTGVLKGDLKTAKFAELSKLGDDIKADIATAQEQIINKEDELLAPLLTKIQVAIDDIAAEEQYVLVINVPSDARFSTVLYGDAPDNLSEKILKKLGVTVPAGRN